MPGTTGNVRPVPAHVDLLVAFTNTVDHELGTDELTTPAELTRWLVGHGLLERSTRSTHEDVTLARRLRDGLHAALVAHHDGEDDAGALADAADALPLQLAVDGGRPSLAPAQDGVRGALARLLVAVTAATADDTWPRLKICAADDCRWAYVDTTKNRSRSWCEWGCGNKAKTRSYRARRKAATTR
jgi:predicted RNA-binding Zn ribbon-like protein